MSVDRWYHLENVKNEEKAKGFSDLFLGINSTEVMTRKYNMPEEEADGFSDFLGTMLKWRPEDRVLFYSVPLMLSAHTLCAFMELHL